MTPGEVSKQLNTTWKRLDVYGEAAPPKRNITRTMLQKYVSTHCLDEDPEASEPATDLLAHSQTTQRKYYNVRKQELSSGIEAHHVGNISRGTSPSSPSRKKWSDKVEELKSVFSKHIEKKLITLENASQKRHSSASTLKKKLNNFCSIHYFFAKSYNCTEE